MTLKLKKAREALAQRLRELAQSNEREPRSFTCVQVGRECGYPVRAAYAAAFGFEGEYETGSNEDVLWNMSTKEMADVRILLLCFAASLAETGDL